MTLGQIAYEAYSKAWHERSGYYEPAWNNIGESAQAAWEAAANAVMAFAEG
jgi:hypothetical protein